MSFWKNHYFIGGDLIQKISGFWIWGEVSYKIDECSGDQLERFTGGAIFVPELKFSDEGYWEKQ